MIIELLLGLAAWMLPIIGLALYKRGRAFPAGLSVASLAACALAPLPYNSLLADWVAAGDWSAIMDVHPSMNWIYALLALVTIALNLAMLLLYRRRRKE